MASRGRTGLQAAKLSGRSRKPRLRIRANSRATPEARICKKIFAYRLHALIARNFSPPRGLHRSSCTAFFRAEKILEFFFSVARFRASFRSVTISFTGIYAMDAGENPQLLETAALNRTKT